MTTETSSARDEHGRFVPGCGGGPGRPPKRSPLHRAISDDEAVELWRAELARAQGGDADARRFILQHKHGRPAQATPDLPSVAWPAIMGPDDLGAAVTALLAAHASGAVDAAGLRYLADVLATLAKVVEVADLAPQVRSLRDHVDRLGEAG